MKDQSLADAVATTMSIAEPCEGFSAVPYLCPAGVWTIGFGTTILPDGTRVNKDTPAVSRETATSFLKVTAADAVISALKLSPGLIHDMKALGGIGDFVFNLGTGRYRASTLRRKINDRDWHEARSELRKWIRGGGRVLPGLVVRRELEIATLPL